MNKYNEGYAIEGLDRVDTILHLLQDRLGYISDSSNDVHPSIYDRKAVELLMTATDALAALYQHIGQWEDEESKSEVLELPIVDVNLYYREYTDEEVLDMIRKYS